MKKGFTKAAQAGVVTVEFTNVSSRREESEVDSDTYFATLNRPRLLGSRTDGRTN